MATSEDVKTLFRRFGGQPETYQEVVREDLAEHSLGKWPMLGQVNLHKVEAIPAAKQTIKTVATRPYSESLAVAQAGQLAVADYVASHRRAEIAREAAAAAIRPAPMPVEPALMPQESVSVTAPVTTPATAFPPVATRVSVQPHSFQTRNTQAPTRESALPARATPSPAAPRQVEPTQQRPQQPSHQPPSGLAARFRPQVAAAEAVVPQPVELPPQSLHGLFGRLAQSQARPQNATGLLKRKLTK